MSSKIPKMFMHTFDMDNLMMKESISQKLLSKGAATQQIPTAPAKPAPLTQAKARTQRSRLPNAPSTTPKFIAVTGVPTTNEAAQGQAPPPASVSASVGHLLNGQQVVGVEHSSCSTSSCCSSRSGISASTNSTTTTTTTSGYDSCTGASREASCSNGTITTTPTTTSANTGARLSRIPTLSAVHGAPRPVSKPSGCQSSAQRTASVDGLLPQYEPVSVTDARLLASVTSAAEDDLEASKEVQTGEVNRSFAHEAAAVLEADALSTTPMALEPATGTAGEAEDSAAPIPEVGTTAATVAEAEATQSATACAVEAAVMSATVEAAAAAMVAEPAAVTAEEVAYVTFFMVQMLDAAEEAAKAQPRRRPLGLKRKLCKLVHSLFGGCAGRGVEAM